jgi:hypothetical protein
MPRSICNHFRGGHARRARWALAQACTDLQSGRCLTIPCFDVLDGRSGVNEGRLHQKANGNVGATGTAKQTKMGNPILALHPGYTGFLPNKANVKFLSRFKD